MDSICIFTFQLVVYDFTTNSFDDKVGRSTTRGHWSKAVGDNQMGQQILQQH